MDRQINRRLTNLDRRLRAIYNTTLRTALASERRAIQRLANFKPNERLSPQAQERERRRLQLIVERETGIVNNITLELSRTAKLADEMIRGENLNLLEHSYISNSNKIVSRARATGMNINWGMQNRNALNALLNGEHTTAGQMQGYTIPFGLIKDRQTGLFFYERAIRRLGDNQTIIDRLSKELAQSLVLGEGIGQISSRIKKVTDYSHMRAVRIARTETLRVVNQGHMLAARQALEQYDLPMVKVWISTNDDRVRETHEEQQGEEREMDELFSNGLMYPLDPNGAPEEIINCRCVMITRIKGLRGSQAYRDLVERTDPYNSMIGMRTSNGIRVSSISKHLTDRADERNVTAANIRNALTSPLEISTIKIDGKGRASQRFMGIRAMAAINPETGNLISTNATGTQRRRSYARKNS